jgi:hypothetical protein
LFGKFPPGVNRREQHREAESDFLALMSADNPLPVHIRAGGMA